MRAAGLFEDGFRARLAVGDLRAAGALLVEACADEVRALCVAMVRNPAVADDLAQDAFANALRDLATFRDEASPRTWLLAIARNRCIDHLRRAGRAPRVEAGPDGANADPDEHPDDAPLPLERLLRRDDAAAALDALDESERAAVVLRFCSGLGYDELADAFGLTEGAARMRVSRALARMRATLVARGEPRGRRLRGGPPLRGATRGGTAPATVSAEALASAGSLGRALAAILGRTPRAFVKRLDRLVAALPDRA